MPIEIDDDGVVHWSDDKGLRALSSVAFWESMPCESHTPIAVVGPSRMGKTLAMERAVRAAQDGQLLADTGAVICNYYDVFGITPPPVSAAYHLADKLQEALRAVGYVVVDRVGDSVFAHETLDRLEAAGCRIEERGDGGVSIHLPREGCIDGIHDFALHMTNKPLVDRESHQADYLRHDPTKSHKKRRRK